MGLVNFQDGNIRGADLNNVLDNFGGLSFTTGGKFNMAQMGQLFTNNGPAATNPTVAPGAPSFGLG